MCVRSSTIGPAVSQDHMHIDFALRLKITEAIVVVAIRENRNPVLEHAAQCTGTKQI